MNGVISPGVSAGSKKVGAREMCTAQLSEPSGLAAAGPTGASTSSETATASTAVGTRRMRSPVTLGLSPYLDRRDASLRGSSAWLERNNRPTGDEKVRDYPRMAAAVNIRKGLAVRRSATRRGIPGITQSNDPRPPGTSLALGRSRVQRTVVGRTV